MNDKKTKQKISIFWPVFLLLIFGLSLGLAAGAADGGSLGDLSIKNQLQAIAQHPKVNLGSKPPELATVIGSILFGGLGFLGVISLLLIMYAGIKWMLAEGNEETISASKKIIFYAIIGLAIIMGSYAITYYVVDKIWVSTAPEQSINLNTPELPGVTGPVPEMAGECQDDSDCPNCPYGGTKFCNFDTGSGVCGCRNINTCVNEDCSDDCRAEDPNNIGGYCDEANICQCM